MPAAVHPPPAETPAAEDSAPHNEEAAAPLGENRGEAGRRGAAPDEAEADGRAAGP